MVVSTAAIRPRIIEYKSSTTGAPSSDAGYEIQVKRFTAAGTTTALTPASTDSIVLPKPTTPATVEPSARAIKPRNRFIVGAVARQLALKRSWSRREKRGR